MNKFLGMTLFVGGSVWLGIILDAYVSIPLALVLSGFYLLTRE